MSLWSKIFKSTDGSRETNQKKLNEETNKLTDSDKKMLTDEIDQLNRKIASSETYSKADDLTKLGQDYQKMGKVDDAIYAYEKSLKCKEDFGPAFDGLLKLYDIKRQEAAYDKNNDEIQKWLNKSDELTALSKKIMRSK